MAINSLIDHIANHGTDGSVTIGANTPAPYANANLTGFVDGTGPQNASKNMAEFYNRQVFAAKHLIEAAGLTWDPANWAQMTQAVIALGGGLHGGSCAVTGPTAPPSTASPYTKYTSVDPYLEEWEWTGLVWRVISNPMQQIVITPTFAINYSLTALAHVTALRSGRACIRGVTNVSNGTGDVIHGDARLYKNLVLVPDSFVTGLTSRVGAQLILRPIAYIDVAAGDLITLGIYVDAAMAASTPGNGNAVYINYLS